MYAISVAPIRRGFGVEELTYFHSTSLPLGTVVQVPLRKSNVSAIVIASQSVKEAKANLRSADFALKKITSVHNSGLFSPLFITAAENTAHYYASTLGATLSALTPSRLLSDLPEAPIEHMPHDSHEVQAIQDTTTYRYDYYRQIVRTSLALNQSVLIIAPTLADITYLEKALARGISRKVMVLHSGQTKKKQIISWTDAITSVDAIVVITTLQYAGIPRNDFRTIIMERAAARAYTGSARPFINAYISLRYLAQSYGIPLIVGDTLLPFSLRYNLEHSLAIHEPHRIRKRYDRVPYTKLIDMQPYRETTISEQAHALIDSPHRTCIFVSRRGMYPHTICGDCGAPVRCSQCDTPVVVHEHSQHKRVFMCHKCYHIRSAKEYCTHCSSWKLVPLGIGSARVADEIAAAYPDKTIIRIDSDATTTARQAHKAYETFITTQGAVLVCTEMGLSYLRSIPNVIIASLDSMFALPDFRAYERIARIITTLTDVATDACLLQTRNMQADWMEEVLTGSIEPLYSEEMNIRQQMQFPPFGTLVKCTIRGGESTVESTSHTIEKVLHDYKPHTYPAFIPKIKNDFIVNTLIRVPEGEWPHDDVIEQLRSLPQQIQIAVDPESTL